MCIDPRAASDVGGPVSGRTLGAWLRFGGLCLARLSPWLLLLSRGSPASMGVGGWSPGTVTMTVMDVPSAAGRGPDDIVKFHFTVFPQVNWVKSIGA